MNIEVKPIDDSNFNVNGKLFFKDANDKWVCQGLNSVAEIRAAQEHIIKLEK